MGDIDAVLVSKPGPAVVEIVAGDAATLHAIGAPPPTDGHRPVSGRPRGGGRWRGVSRWFGALLGAQVRIPGPDLSDRNPRSDLHGRVIPLLDHAQLHQHGPGPPCTRLSDAHSQAEASGVKHQVKPQRQASTETRQPHVGGVSRNLLYGFKAPRKRGTRRRPRPRAASVSAPAAPGRAPAHRVWSGRGSGPSRSVMPDINS